MTQTTFLEGKVRKQSLPLFHNAPGTNDKGPKRLLLPQGELANFYDANEGIRYMAFIELRLGGIRGNHVHRIKEEQVYLFSGEAELVAQAGGEETRVSVELKAGDLVIISTGVAHAFRPTKPGYAVEFSTARFDPSDIQKLSLI